MIERVPLDFTLRIGDLATASRGGKSASGDRSKDEDYQKGSENGFRTRESDRCKHGDQCDNAKRCDSGVNEAHSFWLTIEMSHDCGWHTKRLSRDCARRRRWLWRLVRPERPDRGARTKGLGRVGERGKGSVYLNSGILKNGQPRKRRYHSRRLRPDGSAGMVSQRAGACGYGPRCS